jgi:DNA primase
VSIKSRERVRDRPRQVREVRRDHSIFDQVKAAVTVEALAERFTTLRPAGQSRLKGLCPLHTERTPSFHVNSDSDLWHCFGVCQRGGDVITLAQCLMDKGLL